MWRRRIAVAVVLTVLAAAGGVGVVPPGPAWAAGRGDQIYGDVDGDGATDRITLGLVQPDFCSVIVEYGNGSGGYRPPVASVYLRPGGTGIGTRCPEIGVAVDLGNDHRDELVVAWYPGPPPSLPYNLLVLDNAFQPAFGLVQAIFAPYFLGTADFNGDGRQDVYSVTDQGQGIETYLSLGDGTLAHGSIAWCAGPFTYQLRDLDLDGGTDVVTAFTERCQPSFATGVSVLRGNGAPQELQGDPAGLETWTARVLNANGDRYPDIRTVSGTTSRVDHFIGTPDGTFVLAPRARTDTVYLTGTRRVAIAVLANDYATTDARVTVVRAPRYGTTQVTTDRQIVYAPGAAHGATDTFTYEITEGGRRSRATVYLRFTD